MANLARGERMVQIFVYLMAHYSNRYSVSEIMQNLEIPEKDLRSVQRDMVALMEIPGGYVQREVESGRIYYRVNLPKAGQLIFPEFGEILLQYAYLKRVANIYPATSSLVTELVEKISAGLPQKMQDELKRTSKSLSERILFMGAPPEYNEDLGKKLAIILKAINQSRKIKVAYTDNKNVFTDKVRIPLMIVVEGGEPYVACVSQHDPKSTYALKVRRIQEVQLAKETFTASPATLENIRKRVQTGAFFFGEQDPKSEDIEIYFPNYSKNALAERPYNRSMKIEDSDSTTIRVTMKADVNESLKQWVMFHGSRAEVKKPEKLKKMLIDEAKKMIALLEK